MKNRNQETFGQNREQQGKEEGQRHQQGQGREDRNKHNIYGKNEQNRKSQEDYNRAPTPASKRYEEEEGSTEQDSNKRNGSARGG